MYYNHRIFEYSVCIIMYMSAQIASLFLLVQVPVKFAFHFYIIMAMYYTGETQLTEKATSEADKAVVTVLQTIEFKISLYLSL